jgi:hypothetical protein
VSVAGRNAAGLRPRVGVDDRSVHGETGRGRIPARINRRGRRSRPMRKSSDRLRPGRCGVRDALELDCQGAHPPDRQPTPRAADQGRAGQVLSPRPMNGCHAQSLPRWHRTLDGARRRDSGLDLGDEGPTPLVRMRG